MNIGMVADHNCHNQIINCHKPPMLLLGGLQLGSVRKKEVTLLKQYHRGVQNILIVVE